MSSETPPPFQHLQQRVIRQPERPGAYRGTYSPARQGPMMRPRSMNGAQSNQNRVNMLPASPRPSSRCLSPTPCVSLGDLAYALDSSPSSLSRKLSESSESIDGANPLPPPQMMSPNSKERTFTSIMSDAFDLTNSPTNLGRRLSFGAGYYEGSLLEAPMSPPSSYGKSSFARTSPMQSGKRAASSEARPPFKQVKTDSDSSPSSASRKSNRTPIDLDGWDVPSDLSGSSDDMVVDARKASKLLDRMRSNIRQSKELTDIFAKFIQQTTKDRYQRTSRSDRARGQIAKPFRYTETPGSSSRSSAVGNGGDSPDPPRDPNSFRGHMIERQDISATDTESETDRNPEQENSNSLPVLGSPLGQSRPVPLGDGHISTVTHDVDPKVVFSVPYLPDDVKLSLNTNDYSHGIVFPNPSPTGGNEWCFENLDLFSESCQSGENDNVAQADVPTPSFSRQSSLISESQRNIRSDAPSPDRQLPCNIGPQNTTTPEEPNTSLLSKASQSMKKTVRFDLPSPKTHASAFPGEEWESSCQGSDNESGASKTDDHVDGANFQFDLPLRGKPFSQVYGADFLSGNLESSPDPLDVEDSIRRQLCAALQTGVATPPPIRPPSPAFHSIFSNASPSGPPAPPSSPLQP